MKLEPILSQPTAPIKGASVEVMRDPLLNGADNNKMLAERQAKAAAARPMSERVNELLASRAAANGQSEAPVEAPSLSGESPASPGAKLNNNTSVEAQSVSEAPEAVVPAEEKAPDPLSSQYAMIARKERAIRAREAAIRAKEAEIEARRASVAEAAAPKAPTFDESKYISKEKLMEDTFGTLSEIGLGYDELTERALNAPKANELALSRELKALREEIKALKGDNESTKKSFEESQKQQYDQAVNQINRDAQMLIKSDPNYELIRETGSTREVVKLIEKTFSEDGYLLTVEEAAQMVEDHLLEQAERIARTKKIQQRLAPKSSGETRQQVSQPAQQSQLKTLTNSVSTTRKLTARERAIAAFEGRKA